MDSVLVQQPPDTWESFPLFQVLNNYLRVDGEYTLLFSLDSRFMALTNGSRERGERKEN